MYIDPAAGSMVIQVVAAAAISVAAMFGRVREGVRTLVTSVLGRRRRSH